MRWLCDEMLARLARLLRAAGHDTALAEPSAPDVQLVQQAREQGRLLLTRDRQLAAAAGDDAVLLRADDPAKQAEELASAVPADWRGQRFTRCLVDNTRLVSASPQQVAQMPESARSAPGPFHACPACGRLYWPGSHVKRLQGRLDRLAAIAETSGAAQG